MDSDVKVFEDNVISVFGSNEPVDGDEAFLRAHEVGKTIARLGYQVANGGYGGTMEASARGARSLGGETIGVTCSVWKSSPNAYINRIISTENLNERLDTIIHAGTSGYVVLNGATGTLAELACVWELTAKGQLPRRPIVCLGDFWRPVVELMAQERPSSAEYVSFVEMPRELSKHFESLMAGWLSGPSGSAKEKEPATAYTVPSWGAIPSVGFVYGPPVDAAPLPQCNTMLSSNANENP